MEWAHVLIWIVCIATGLNVLILARNPAGRRSWWLWLQLALLLLTLGIAPASKPLAALLGGSLWLLLVLWPSLLSRRLQRLVSARHFTHAARLNRLLGWFHPNDAIRPQQKFLEALAHHAAGREKEALQQLQDLAKTSHLYQDIARYMSLRLQRDWEGLKQAILHTDKDKDTEEDKDDLDLNPTQLLWLLLAEAEAGHLPELLRLYKQGQARGLLAGPNQIDIWSIMMAFTGQTTVLQTLFRGPLYHWSPQSKELLLATAEQAAGQTEAATARLQALSKHPDQTIAKRAEYRLKVPVPQVEQALNEDQRRDVEQIAAQILHELPYTGQQDLAKKPLWTWGFSLVLLVYYLLSEWRGGSTNTQVLYDMGAMLPALVLKGEYWRLFTFPLLHAGPIHFLLNQLALLMFGPFVERQLGSLRYLLLLLLSAVGGGCLITLAAKLQLHPHLLQSAYVGASGALFGLIGAMLAIMLQGWRKEGLHLAKQRVKWLLLIIGLQTAFDVTTPSVSLGAHWSGLLLGLLLTTIVWPHRPKNHAQK